METRRIRFYDEDDKQLAEWLHVTAVPDIGARVRLHLPDPELEVIKDFMILEVFWVHDKIVNIRCELAKGRGVGVGPH